MHGYQIEPVTLLGTGLKELHFAISEGSEDSLIPHMAHSVKGELRVAFLQQDGFNHDVVRFWRLAEIVDQAGHLEQIQCSIAALLSRIIVIAVY